MLETVKLAMHYRSGFSLCINALVDPPSSSNLEAHRRF